jgi:caffeoyl-CoA O-methyltransferase
MMDNLFNKQLQNYILDTTDPEPLLLKNLRLETAQHIGQEHMLCGPIEGKFLQMLVKIKNAKNCLELGTFTGYSALYIAAGLPIDGKLITCELNPTHAHFAQNFFDRSPHGHKIELRLGEAMQTIHSLSLPLDFIFIDADKQNYFNYYEKLIPLLAPGGIMVVDNALWKSKVIEESLDKTAQAIHTLNLHAATDPRVETVMLAIRDGLLLIRKN